MKFRFLLLLLVCIWFETKTFARSPEIDISIFDFRNPIGKHIELAIDPDQTLSAAAVLDEKYQDQFTLSKQDNPSIGIAGTTVWGRLVFYNPSFVHKKIYIENRYANIDELAFYYIEPNGKLNSKIIGDKVDFETRDIKYRYPVFEYSIPPGRSHIAFRARTQGVILFAFQLWNPSDFIAYVHYDYSIIGAVGGFLLLMSIYYVLLYFWTKDISFVLYGCYIFSILQVVLGFLGASFEWFPGFIGKWLSNSGLLFFIGFSATLAFAFTARFLNLKESMPRWHQSYKVLILIEFILSISSIFGPYHFFAKAVNFSTFIAAIIILYTSVYSMVKGYKPARFYISVWLVEIVAVIYMGMKAEGFAQISIITEWGLPVGSVLNILLVSIALIDRLIYFSNNAKFKIEALNSQLEKHLHVIEYQVELRTEQIRGILDNVKSGFLTIDKKGLIKEGFTKSCTQLFGQNLSVGSKLVDAIEFSDYQRELFSLAIEQVFDDKIPELASLNQIPKSVTTNKKNLNIEGALIRSQEGKPKEILFTINDSTEYIKREKEAKDNGLLLRVINNIDSFKHFISYTRDRLNWIKQYVNEPMSDEVQQVLHTLKGNTLIFGLESIAQKIHQFEDEEIINSKNIAEIESSYKYFLKTNEHMLHAQWENDELDYLVSEPDMKKMREIASRLPSGNLEIEYWLTKVMSKSIRSLLGPIREDIESLADRLGKKVNFSIEGSELKVYTQNAEKIVKQLIHILRNAIIHGIEDDRYKVNKPGFANITLNFKKVGDFGIEIICEDDGKGIVLKDRKSLNLVDYYKKSGITTTTEIDLYSGRGVGITSVINVVNEAKGEISIDSKPGKGTKFRIYFNEFQAFERLNQKAT